MGVGASWREIHWGDWEGHFPDLSALVPGCLASMDCAGQRTLVIGPMAAASAALAEVGAEVWTHAVGSAAYVPRCPRLLLGELTWLQQHPRWLMAGAPLFSRVFCGAGAWRWLGGAEELEVFAGALAAMSAPGGVLGLVLPGVAGPAPTYCDVGDGERVLVVRQGLVGQRWESRFVAGRAPRVDRGYCPEAGIWRRVLREAGFEVREEVTLALGDHFFLKSCRV